jgi:hypothetical protein
MLAEDVALQSSDITSLDSRDAVRDFLVRLGYDVSQARQTFPDAEGMPQRLQEVVKYLELSASDAPFLDVYLIELSSVTVAHIQALATHFKNRAGQVLAILTQDYKRLDFVLFDLRYADSQGKSTGTVRVLPRRFTFDCQHPSPDRLRVILRFLRRLTWTEPDGLAQWDKLRSAFSIAEWSEEFFDNRGLFADYYLKNRLPEHPAWSDAALRPARDQLRQEIAAARAQFREADEAALRGGLLVPLLKGLGFEPKECKSASDDSVRAPDYELLDPQTGEKLAVCLAYQWDRFLDGPDPKDQQTPEENPGAAVLELLQDNDWAIVTNGKHWRLYSARTESRATNFYQVDAEEIAADPEGDAFRYFWLMFRADAFSPCEVAVAGEPRAACFLEELLDGSRKYAKEVGDRLKGRVFQDIFPILAEGFIGDLRHRDGEGADLAEEQLGLVYNATLTLLYRLLFLLYAESRDLLPVAEIGGYYEKSLTALKDEVAAAAGTAEGQRDEHLATAYSADPRQVSLWNRLTDLFAIIGDGRSELNVPKYNGGLFLTLLDEAVEDHERQLAEFLATHALSDRHLARAIDRLARDPDDKTHGLVMIDFKSLGVRQLGSIYEGLLEFKVRIAQEKMAVCTEKSREVVLPYAEAAGKKGVTIKRKGRGRDAEEEVLLPGDVYLENSKHERKASGSYYTPDYIVQYIVTHTVGPVLDEKLEALRGDLNRACADFRKFRQQKQAEGLSPHDGLIKNSDLERRVIQQCFDLSVLDPAMGSGHFLVTAVDFIADRLIHFLNGFPHNPVERMLNDTRRAIVDQAVREGLVLDESKLTHINLLKRHVLKRCIYGVDLNAMAVELAKVSLWLHCFTLGAPLSFLDHHLKWGNSLIGEAGATSQEQAPQGGFDDFSRWHDFSEAVKAYLRISGSEDATIAQVAASRDGFKKAEDILRPHREKLNVQTAGYFAEPKNEKKRAVWVGQAEQQATTEGIAGWQQAQDLGEEHRFFHWPLEFPEIWYEPRPGAEKQAVVPKAEGKAGFDAVVGNPPYVRAESADKAEREWIQTSGRYDTICGRFDVYAVFVESGINLVHEGGSVGFIIPAAFLTINYTAKLRAALLRDSTVATIVDLRDQDVFPDAAVQTCVIGIERKTPQQDSKYHLCRVLGAQQIQDTGSLVPTQLSILQVEDQPIRLDAVATQFALKSRVDAISSPLGNLCYCITGVVAHDSETGASKDRLIHVSRINDTCRPYFEAKEWPGRYIPVAPKRFIEYRPEEMHRAKFPELFESAKILVQAIAPNGPIPAVLDETGVYANHSMNCCVKLENVLHLGPRLNLGPIAEPPDQKYELRAILTLISSRMMASYKQLFIGHELGVFPETLRRLPIRRLDFEHATESACVERLLRRATSVDYRAILSSATAALRAHAIHHGPAGKPELREEYLAALDSLHPHQPMPPDIPEDPADFPGREDFVHDLLALLAQRMMDLNQEKHAEIGRFVDALQEQFGFDVEDLVRKTHLKGYHEAGFERLEAALRSNRTRLRQPVEGQLATRLREDYEASMALLRPLEEKLTQTDRLIDQIVYRLYGLTAEEVAIVEGTGVDEPLDTV